MAVDPKDFDTKHMRLMRERDAALARAEAVETELAALRIIASDHLAGSNLTVKPEDAADVVKWAANPGAVRELLKWAPMYGYDGQCPSCAEQTERTSHRRDCSLIAAWRALGDPRGAADIERAHEEANAEHARRFPTGPVNGANEGDLVEVRVEADGAMTMLGVVARMIGT